MRSILLAAVVMTGVLTLTMPNASAAQSSGLAPMHVASVYGTVTKVDYWQYHHRWHHRHWHHGHWRYWN